MIQQLKLAEPKRRQTARSAAGKLVFLGSIVSWMIFSAGCQGPRVVVIPADKEVTFLKAGQTYVAQTDVYIIPPARMQEILHALSDKATPR